MERDLWKLEDFIIEKKKELNKKPEWIGHIFGGKSCASQFLQVL